MSTIQLNNSLFDNISTKCGGILYDGTSAGLYTMSTFLLSNFVVGLPANLWEVWLICHGTRELFASEMYHLSLAVCEILYCLGLPAQLYCMYRFEHVSYGLVILLSIQAVLLWIARPVFQSCICMERYFAVVHPLIFIRFKPLKYKVAQCALAWCAFILIVALSWTMINIEIVLIWFVPMLCMVLYCYFSVLCSLKRAGPGERGGEQKRGGDKIKRKAFDIFLVHLLCFLVSYPPALIIKYLGELIYIPSPVVDLMTCLGIVCGNIQPLLYLHRAGKLSCLKRSLT